MKKLLIVFVALFTILSFSLMTTLSVKADTTLSTSDFMPHRYVLSGYDIPTAMTYDENSVSFSGSLNAGIATTGFSYIKPIDITNFSIEMDLNIPDMDKLTWICFSFLDTNLMTDSENDTAPVAMPFNAMSGKSGYNNKEQTGLVLQLYPHENNIYGLDYVSKNLDFETGQKSTSGWKPYTTTSMISAVKFDDEFDGKFKLSLSATDGALSINLQDGAWKYEDSEGNYTQTSENGLLYANNTGLLSYFENKDCYFACVLMYKDEEHRPVTLKVEKFNGLNPSDNKEPSYLEPKVIEKDEIKAIIPANSIGIFGVYPSSIDNLKVVKYDEEDGDYEVVNSRASSLKGTLIDVFRVVPQVGTNNINLVNPITVEYTLPTGYAEYKAYYINDDEETQAFPKSYMEVKDGKMSLKIDNDVITKVAIYGLTESSDTPISTTTTNNTNPTTNTTNQASKGCKSMISSIILPLSLGSIVLGVALKKKREE